MRLRQGDSYVIADAARSGLIVHSVDDENIGVVFTVYLLPMAVVHSYRPQLKHLPHHSSAYKEKSDRELGFNIASAVSHRYTLQRRNIVFCRNDLASHDYPRPH